MYKLKLIIRYLIKRRITHFAVLAVALCVFIVVVVMTVMNSLVWEFKQKNHEHVGDCVVATKSLVGFPYYEEFIGLLEETDFVEAASPVVKNYALLRPEAFDLTENVQIVGIDPVRHSRVTNFAETLHYRTDEADDIFRPTYDPSLLGCVLGSDLAWWRNFHAQLGYDVQPAKRAYALTCFPLNAAGAPARAGTSIVATQRFYYSDHAQTGIPRIDSWTVYIPLEQAQRLCMDGELERVTAIHVKFRDAGRVRQNSARVRDMWDRFVEGKQDAQDAHLLNTVVVEDWREHRREAIAPMEREEVILSIMFVFVGITTVFIVCVVFYMIVSHKTRDIGILKSVGASDTSVMGLFSGFALAIGVLGSGGGTLAGLVFLARINQVENWLFERFGWQLWDRTVYAIGDIPNQITVGLVVVIIGSALLACQIGALVPGYVAVRLRPVETLHGSRT